MRRGYPDINFYSGNCERTHAQGLGRDCRWDAWMRFLGTLAAAVLLAVPAPARADAGDIIVQREPGASAREVRKDAGVRLVDSLPIERTELVEPKDGDVAEALE